MNKKSPYFLQAQLVTRILPLVEKEKCFALKGGTAICFFYRNLPRLSVDIDLTYLPIEEREVSLKKISAALERISRLASKLRFQVEPGKNKDGRIHKLFISDSRNRIKIESNDVLRGSIHPPEIKTLTLDAENTFETSVKIQILSFSDLYAGKLCAALDRQHPRDLFDVKLLLENEGITPEIRKAFVVYLACHDRPIHELINPNRKDIRPAFDREFRGMSIEPITIEELESARETMISKLSSEMSDNERFFLISVKEGEPKPDLIGLPNIENLPGLKWKIINIKKMSKTKHTDYLNRLRERLGV